MASFKSRANFAPLGEATRTDLGLSFERSALMVWIPFEFGQACEMVFYYHD